MNITKKTAINHIANLRITSQNPDASSKERKKGRLTREWSVLAYGVLVSGSTERDFSGRQHIDQVSNDDRRFASVARVNSEDVVAFANCHCAVARHAAAQTAPRSNVNLHIHNGGGQ